MVRQISLDACQTQRLAELLEKGSQAVRSTGEPIILYRQTVEEEEGAYEEIVCTLADGYIVEQLIVSGGLLVPSIRKQSVVPVERYPEKLIRQSIERFQEMASLLESRLE